MTGPALLRSALYLPASNPRALEKAKTLPADAIIFDLEDAVAPGKKSEARQLLAQALTEGGFGARKRLVRVNALATAWGEADMTALRGLDFDGAVLPKVGSPEEIAVAQAHLGGVPIWAMIETPQGVEAAYAIADVAGGLILGTNDLARELNTRSHPDRLPLIYALQRSLMAARSAGIPCLDGVFNAIDDVKGLARECAQGRDFGFTGKSLIHPSQIEAANRAFSPTSEEIDLAQRQIAAFEGALAEGRAVAVVDGRIVENLHIVMARAVLAQAQAISET